MKINPNKDVEIAAVAPCPILMCPGQRAETIAEDLAGLAMCYGIDVIRARGSAFCSTGASRTIDYRQSCEPVLTRSLHMACSGRLIG
jgi:hypothetical protein